MNDMPDIPDFLDRRPKRPDALTVQAVSVDIPATEPLLDEIEALLNGEAPKRAKKRLKEPVTIELVAEPEPADIEAGTEGPQQQLPTISEPSNFDNGSHGLIRYEEACRAIAEAAQVDEVKDIRDQALAMRLYARQAKNRELEADAFEIRSRAERRIGQMMAEQPRAGVGEHKRFSENPLPTLADAGIDKNLAHRSRSAAKLADTQFESWVREKREEITVDEKALPEEPEAIPDTVTTEAEEETAPRYEFDVVGTLISRFDRITAEGRAHMQFVNAHAADISAKVEASAAEAARMWRDIHQRIRTLAAANRAEQRAGSNVIKLGIAPPAE